DLAGARAATVPCDERRGAYEDAGDGRVARGRRRPRAACEEAAGRGQDARKQERDAPFHRRELYLQSPVPATSPRWGEPLRFKTLQCPLPVTRSTVRVVIVPSMTSWSTS